MLTVCAVHAQSPEQTKAVATVTATANVVGNVDLIVMKDLEFDVSSLAPTDLVLDPQNDPRCGKIKIVGSPNNLVRVTNEKQSVLQHESTQSQLFFTYNISGNTIDDQPESVLLTQSNEVQLSDQGVYYLWVGGLLSGVEDIMPGNYTIQLTLDVEYVR